MILANYRGILLAMDLFHVTSPPEALRVPSAFFSSSELRLNEMGSKERDYETNAFWISFCMDSTMAMGSLALLIGRPTTT